MTAIVNTPPKGVPPVKVSFTWTPHVPHGGGSEEQSVISYPTSEGQVYPFFVGQASKTQEALWKTEYKRYGAWEAELGAAITFTAAATLPTGVTAHTYHWDFDDGTTGEGSTITHTFKVDDQINVILTLTDSRGYEWQAHQYFTLVIPTRATYKGAMRPFTMRVNRKAQAGGLFRSVEEKAVSTDEAVIKNIHLKAMKLPLGDSAIATDVITQNVHLFRSTVGESAGITDSVIRTWNPHRTASDTAVTEDTSANRKLVFKRAIADNAVSADTESPLPVRTRHIPATLGLESRIVRYQESTLTFLEFLVNFVPRKVK